jgi:hypothetical protein
VVGGAAEGAVGALGTAGKNFAMNVPFVGGRTWVRRAKRLDDWRMDNRIVKHIPLIGGYSKEYNDKLDRRQEKELKWKEESRQARLSHDEERTCVDRGAEK